MKMKRNIIIRNLTQIIKNNKQNIIKNEIINEKITSRSKNYSDWYSDVLNAADMIEQCSVRGCVILKPLAMDIWETIRSNLDKKIRKTGTQNYYFPLLIPTSLLSMEASHIEGFAKECAVVTHHRLKSNPNYNPLTCSPSEALEIDKDAKLEEPLVIRPTSEAAMWTSFRKWIHSYRDLPLKVNQWANVIRWELRPRPFLRTSEFLWQEGHTAHATKEDALNTTIEMINIYEKLCNDLLALPVIKGIKSKSETFAGADQTYTIEGLMQNGWALQCGTSHFLGKNFSEAFDVKYQDENGILQSVWATSWGVSTRLIGALIMSHSDDIGLVLPPKIAPIQIVLIPIYNKKTTPENISLILSILENLINQFEQVNIRCEIDNRPHLRIGAKYYEWERKGVPLRIVLGERDFISSSSSSENNIEKKMILSIFDRVNYQEMKWEYSTTNDETNQFIMKIQNLLNNIQQNLYNRANERLENSIYRVNNYEEMKNGLIENPGFYLVPWKESSENEEKIKNDCKATIRCYPLKYNSEPIENGLKCFYSNDQATHWALFSRAY